VTERLTDKKAYNSIMLGTDRLCWSTKKWKVYYPMSYIQNI